MVMLGTQCHAWHIVPYKLINALYIVSPHTLTSQIIFSDTGNDPVNDLLPSYKVDPEGYSFYSLLLCHDHRTHEQMLLLET